MALRSLQRLALVLTTFLTLFAIAATPAAAADKPKFKLAWTIYAGWMPWTYAVDKGIVKKWADKYGIDIEVVQLNDYVESINQYTAGKFDGVTLTNMDALTIPAAGGVDTTVLINGDFSNGNDGVILKGKGKKLADIKGQKVNLVELSVSHYLLARALETVKLKEKDLSVVNTSDADIVAAYKAPGTTAVVPWNPQLSEILNGNGDATLVFDSSKIPGEIIDMTVINTSVLKKSPEFGKAIAGAWFETMSIMSKNDPQGQDARANMGKASGTDLSGYEKQLKTTRMFYTPAEAAAFTESADLVKTMNLVRNFSFDHGLLGQGAKSVDVVGIEFPGGKTLGDKNNIKLRFSPEYMRMAAQGKL
ncbi:MAG: ABC transporter substrate-binding protein [Gammaproteobacteria bacterium]|nr:ABC transporter substrate-binding protein [Gammaproteobacteria bacterium]